MPPASGVASADGDTRQPEGSPTERRGAPITGLACGDAVDDLLPPIPGLTVDGDFPDRVAGGADGMFGGSVTITNTEPTVSGVTSPWADMYRA